MKKLSEHFTAEQFVCHCGKCPGSDPERVPMEPKLIHELELMQRLMDRPIEVVSGFRCINRQNELNGNGGSEHIKGNAADITVATYDGFWAYQKLIALCWNNSSFKFVCVHDRYIHVDVGHERQRPRINKSHFDISKTGVTQTDIFEKEYNYREGTA